MALVWSEEVAKVQEQGECEEVGEVQEQGEGGEESVKVVKEGLSETSVRRKEVVVVKKRMERGAPRVERELNSMRTCW